MNSKILAAGAALMTAGLLAGCGGGDDSGAALAAPAAAEQSTAVRPAAASDDREAKLKVAAQGYINAFMNGQVAGVLGYLDPEVCDDDDEASYVLTTGMVADVANGATMKITSVYVEGDRGGVEDQELSSNASDQLRRLVKAADSGGRKYSWNSRDGEGYLAKPCLDEETAS